jgi:hypothetical protein
MTDMSYCRQCDLHYREPPDEQGDHPCPRCGLLPYERGTDDDDDLLDYHREPPHRKVTDEASE